MAEHQIGLKIPKEIEILNRDIKIIVRRDGIRFGTLTISKGTIDWRPVNAKRGKTGETQLGWSKFDEVMKRANRRRQ